MVKYRLTYFEAIFENRHRIMIQDEFINYNL